MMTDRRWEMGRRAYFLRSKAGLEWQAIANKLGCGHRATPWMAAREWAREQEMPWPLQRWSEGRMIWEMYNQGMTEPEIISELGMVRCHVRKAAREWARRNGREWLWD